MTIDIVMRLYEDLDPRWQYYGITLGVAGGGGDLHEAKELAQEAVTLTTHQPANAIQFHTERLALEETDTDPAVYVRAMHDTNPHRRHMRQEQQLQYVTMLRGNPGLRRTFGSLVAATGDSIAVVVFPDDRVSTALRNASEYDTVFFGMPDDDYIYWLPVSGILAEDLPQHADELRINPDSTMRSMMMNYGYKDIEKARTLVMA